MFLDLEASLQKALALIDKAAADGARLLVFPEAFLPAWPAWVDEVLPGEDEAWHVRLLEQSAVVPGPVTERLGAAARNAGGRLLGKHRKLMPTHAERLVWGMGDGSDLRVHQTGLGRVGGLICWQNYMPLARFALYAQGVHTTRGQLVQVGADARRHLKALIVTAPEPLRQALRRRSWLQQARACAALQAAPTDSVEQRATVRALRLTAERILAVYAEAAELKQELRALITSMAPGLLDQPGVGPISAAQVLLARSHPGRVRSEAAFAMLGGAAPIEASSGQIVRHRLNRAARSSNVTCQAWLAALEARAHAGMNNAGDYRTAQDRANAVVNETRLAERRHGMDFDGNELSLSYYEGTSLATLRESRAAQPVLEEALRVQRSGHLKAQSIVRIALATTYVQQNEIEEAWRSAGRAREIPPEQRIGPIAQRVSDLRAQLAPWRTTAAVKDLDEQLAELRMTG